MNIPPQAGLARVDASSKAIRQATALTQRATHKDPPTKAQHAVQALESQILADWLQSLQKAFSSLGGESDPAVGENYRYLSTQALADHLAANGGLGIGTMLLHSLHLEDDKNRATPPNAVPLPADSNP